VAALTLPERPGLLTAALARDGVVTVTMVDAAGKNALSHAMVDALGEAFAALERRADVRAVVLAGLPEIFCSGASVEVLDDLVSGRRQASELLLPRLLLDCAVPCIAAMAGHAVGGGFAFGVAADVVLLGAESRYGLNFLNMGFTPGMGTTRLLEHVLSPAVAHELLYSGEARRGRDFAARSGVNHILPRAEVLPRALDLAARIAEKPRPSLVALKRTLSAARRQAFEAARTQEALMHAVSFAQPEVAQLIADAFKIPPTQGDNEP
jgi:polyketide biosynthesis enoyl-CoA hydratase PksI